MDIGTTLGTAMDPKANAAKLTAAEIQLAKERFYLAKERAAKANLAVYEAELAYLESKGEGESRDAQFARAAIEGDQAAMHRLNIEGEALRRSRHAKFYAEQEAEIAEAAKRIGSVQ